MSAGLTEAERQQALERYQCAMRQCQRCVVAGYISSAFPVFHGSAALRMMVVGQAPAAHTAERPLPYSGATGRTLSGWLERAGFAATDLHTRFYLTSLTKCFPGPSLSGKGDRTPSPAEIKLCRPHLERELVLVQPELILPLGRLAVTYFLGNRPLSVLVGQAHRRDSCYVLPLPHPSGVSRWLNDPANRALLDQALAQLSELRIRLSLD